MGDDTISLDGWAEVVRLADMVEDRAPVNPPKTVFERLADLAPDLAKEGKFAIVRSFGAAAASSPETASGSDVLVMQLADVLARAVANGGACHIGHEDPCPVAPGTKIVDGKVVEGLSKDPEACTCWVRDAGRLLRQAWRNRERANQTSTPARFEGLVPGDRRRTVGGQGTEAEQVSEGGTSMRAPGESPDPVDRGSGMAGNSSGEQSHEGAGASEPVRSPGSISDNARDPGELRREVCSLIWKEWEAVHREHKGQANAVTFACKALATRACDAVTALLDAEHDASDTGGAK